MLTESSLSKPPKPQASGLRVREPGAWAAGLLGECRARLAEAERLERSLGRRPLRSPRRTHAYLGRPARPSGPPGGCSRPSEGVGGRAGPGFIPCGGLAPTVRVYPALPCLPLRPPAAPGGGGRAGDPLKLV